MTDVILHPIPESRVRLGGIGHTTFYQLVRERKIRLTKIGRRSFVRSDDLATAIDNLTREAA